MLWKTALKVLISAQFLLSPLATVAHADFQGPPPTGSDAYESLDGQPDNQAEDLWALRGQYVEVFEGFKVPMYSYKLDTPSVERPKLAYTQIRPYVDKEKGCLAIEALRGANDQGENGQVVARMYFPQINNVAAIVKDREVLSIVDQDGKISLVDWGYVSEQAFRALVPVHRYTWAPAKPMDLRGHDVKMNYLTIAHQPIDENRLLPGAVLPHDEKGNLRYESGSLLVTVDDNVLGVFDRDVAFKSMQTGKAILYVLALIAQRRTENNDQVAEIFQKADLDQATIEAELSRQGGMDEMTALLFGALGTDHLKSLSGRIAKIKEQRNAPRDWFYHDEWVAAFERLKNAALARNEAAGEENIAAAWNKTIEEHHKEVVETSSPKTIAALLATVSAFMLLPVAYEHLPYLHQFNLIARAYQLFPSVLRDASYRWPLLKSTLSLMAFWPAGMGISWLAGKTLDKLSAVSQSSNSPLARKVRDLARDWGSTLSVWQRITSFGMRIYSSLLLAPWIHAVETALQQPNAIAAATLNLNAFKKIEADSDIGRRVGLKSDMRLGVLNPFARDYKERVAKQRELMAEVIKDRNQLKEHNWLLAAMVVAQEYDIDIVTLTKLHGMPNPSVNELRALLNKEEVRRDWELVADRLNKEITALPLMVEVGGEKVFDPDEMEQQYIVARQLAKKIKAIKGIREDLMELKIKARRRAMAFKNVVLNLGRDQYTFLKTIFSSKFVAEQVEREFVTDHFMVVYLISLFGARADLSHPENLAAMSGGWLWNSPQHLSDVGGNTQAHFFMASSILAVIYQAIKASKETAYEPREDHLYKEPTAPRGVVAEKFASAKKTVWPWGGQVEKERRNEQAFVPGLFAYFASAFNPLEVDFGGQSAKWLNTRSQGFFAFYWMSVAMRTMFGNQSLHDAAFAANLAFVTQYWWYSAFWTFIQRGTQIYENKFAEKHDRFMKARRDLAWGLRERIPESKEKLLRDGVREMRDMFQQYNRKVELPDEGTDLEVQARSLLSLTERHTPGALHANSLVKRVGVLTGAAATTILAVPWIIMTYNPANLNMAHLANWTVLSGALFGLSYMTTSKWAFENVPVIKDIPNVVKASGRAVRKVFSPQAWRERFKSCEEEMTAP